MSTKMALSLCAIALLTAAPALLADDCDYTAAREASVDAAGATLVEIDAAAGSLSVGGRPGLARVEARGEACASDEELLDGIQIVARRTGDRVRIVAEIPESGRSWRSQTARLDLTVDVPADVPLRIDDSSGEIEVKNVAAAEIDDSSGEIRVDNVAGDLGIDDSSGEINVTEVGGDVRIRDGSGGIDVRRVRGSVVIEEDGSGSIDVADVEADVTIREDGSGSIRVRDVGGDFTVERDGSGGIDHRGVAGRVDVPRRDRDR